MKKKMRKKEIDARLVCYQVLYRFESQWSRLDDLIEQAFSNYDLSARGRRFIRKVVTGFVRYKSYLDWLAKQNYQGRYKKLLNRFKIIYRLALYEILFMDAIPERATVFEYVNLARRQLDEKHAGLLNGLLRNFLRQQAGNYLAELKKKDKAEQWSIMYSYPQWLIKRWIAIFGEEQTKALCEAFNKEPDFDIHINSDKIPPNEFKKKVRGAGVEFLENSSNPDVIRVKELQAFKQRGWFEKGYCWVQDESAALIAGQVDMQPGQKILDLCAAPGGKFLQLQRRLPQDALLVGMDSDLQRLKKLRQLLKRMGVDRVPLVVGDGRLPPFRIQFDRILLDAPCSGLGVIRKHPDIKWRRNFNDILEFANLQKQLLKAAAGILRSGGFLVYSTCTIDPLENENVVDEFLQNENGRFELLPLSGGNNMGPDQKKIATFPHIHDMDGSFCVKMKNVHMK